MQENKWLLHRNFQQHIDGIELIAELDNQVGQQIPPNQQAQYRDQLTQEIIRRIYKEPLDEIVLDLISSLAT